MLGTIHEGISILRKYDETGAVVGVLRKHCAGLAQEQSYLEIAGVNPAGTKSRACLQAFEFAIRRLGGLLVAVARDGGKLRLDHPRGDGGDSQRHARAPRLPVV